MRIKHALWSALADGKAGAFIQTPEKRTALQRWNMVTVMERFGWTPQQYLECPVDLMDDIILITNIRNSQSKNGN